MRGDKTCSTYQDNGYGQCVCRRGELAAGGDSGG